MYIKQITLKNWKVYSGKQTFDFPAPCPEKNIVLIGALNGYGKTSLFNAIVLGIFGRDGMQLIARKTSSERKGGDPAQKSTTYEKFLEKALHRDASEKICSVKLIFINDDGEPLEIKRVWNFTNRGIYQSQGESVLIREGFSREQVFPGLQVYTGRDRRVEGLTRESILPGLDDERYGSECNDWFRDYIAEKLLPLTLAGFFMLDGHQMNALAKREEKAQVREGIEGLLGITVLKGLAKRLRTYATDRRKNSPDVSDEIIEKLEREYVQLTFEYEKKAKRHKKILPKLDKLKEKRTRLTNELSSYGAGSQTLLQEQAEHIKNLEEAIKEDRAQLEELMLEDLALALSGKCLWKNLKKRLDSESVLQNWENGREQGNNNLNRFINLIDDDIRSIEPPLSAGQHEAVLESAKNASKNVWFPQPANCADGYLHPYLDVARRAQVTERLEELSELRSPTFVDILDTITSNENELRRKREEVNQTEIISHRKLDPIRKNLPHLNDKIEKLIKESAELKPAIETLYRQATQKNKKLKRLREELNHAKPSIRRIKNAECVASMIDEIVDKAVPSQVGAVAKAMTQAHRSMAHKKRVKHISIDENCNVKLLTTDDVDLRDYGLSDGEKQIFTQALLSAVSSVSQRNFPTVINNPLELLDHDHRKGVLKNLAQKKGQQVILLSTDKEVVGDYLREIDPYIQRKYLLRFEEVGKGGKTTVHPRLF